MDQVAVGRRLAAARKRADIKTREDLAARVNLPRLGKETLGKIERGERPLYEHEAPYVARALEVPVSYFYEEETADTQLDRIERGLSQLDQALRDASVERVGLVDKILALLDQQSELLARQTELIESLQSAADRLPDGPSLQDHLVQEMRDTLAQTAPPPES